MPASRTAGSRQQVLDVLKTKGRVTNLTLNEVAFRYGARIHELRKEGHRIKSERLPIPGVWLYTYEGKR